MQGMVIVMMAVLVLNTKIAMLEQIVLIVGPEAARVRNLIPRAIPMDIVIAVCFGIQIIAALEHVKHHFLLALVWVQMDFATITLVVLHARTPLVQAYRLHRQVRRRRLQQHVFRAATSVLGTVAQAPHVGIFSWYQIYATVAVHPAAHPHPSALHPLHRHHHLRHHQARRRPLLPCRHPLASAHALTLLPSSTTVLGQTCAALRVRVARTRSLCGNVLCRVSMV